MVESSSLVQAIVDWSASRPHWEQAALVKLARSEQIDDELIGDFASLAEAEASGSTLPTNPVSSSDFRTWMSDSAPVELVHIMEPSAVNALAPDGNLSFGSHGLTLIYGENASGKSGYARIIKKGIIR